MRPEQRTGLPLVTVLVGTDHHQFDRLVDWSLTLAAEGWAQWFVQRGTSAWPACPPATATGAELVGIGKLTDLLQDSAAVVTHAGPGLIIEAHRTGHVPVVVPRDPAHREHVDGHQLRFVAHLSRGAAIRPAHDVDDLRREVRAALLRGRLLPEADTRTTDVTARFGELVDATFRRRQQAALR